MSLSIPSGILAALKADTALYALVGDNIWSTMAPTGTDGSGIPTGVSADGVWIVFERISGMLESAHDGDQSLEHHRYQFTIASTSKETVDTVRDILSRNFNGLNYNYVNGAAESYHLLFLHDNDHESFEETLNRIYLAIVDKQIWTVTQPST